MSPAELAPIIRIGLWALSGYLAAGGYISQELAAVINTDPEVLALATAGLTAVWYVLAKRFGWAK